VILGSIGITSSLGYHKRRGGRFDIAMHVRAKTNRRTRVRVKEEEGTVADAAGGGDGGGEGVLRREMECQVDASANGTVRN